MDFDLIDSTATLLCPQMTQKDLAFVADFLSEHFSAVSKCCVRPECDPLQDGGKVSAASFVLTERGAV